MRQSRRRLDLLNDLDLAKRGSYGSYYYAHYGYYGGSEGRQLAEHSGSDRMS